jgi:hypothetical protein
MMGYKPTLEPKGQLGSQQVGFCRPTGHVGASVGTVLSTTEPTQMFFRCIIVGPTYPYEPTSATRNSVTL